MRYYVYLMLMGLGLIFFSCSKDDDNVEPDVDNPTPDEEIGAEYDDGETIIVNVKIAIDIKGWQYHSPEYHKSQLKTQWNKITERFNAADKDKKLNRTYEFRPDVEDILVYDGKSYGDAHNDPLVSQMDLDKSQCLVRYDFFNDSDERGPAASARKEGVTSILASNAGEQWDGIYCPLYEQDYIYKVLVHELGHFRGIMDIYWCGVNNDPVSGNKFSAISCIMNDIAYKDVNDPAFKWSDYAIKVMNLTGNEKIVDIINTTMFDEFPDNMDFKVTKDGQPAAASVKIYPVESNTVKTTPIISFDVNNINRQDAKSIFYVNPSNNKWNRYHTILVEAKNASGEKIYRYVPTYEVHEAGLDGAKTFTLNLDF